MLRLQDHLGDWWECLVSCLFGHHGITSCLCVRHRWVNCIWTVLKGVNQILNDIDWFWLSLIVISKADRWMKIWLRRWSSCLAWKFGACESSRRLRHIKNSFMVNAKQILQIPSVHTFYIHYIHLLLMYTYIWLYKLYEQYHVVHWCNI